MTKPAFWIAVFTMCGCSEPAGHDSLHPDSLPDAVDARDEVADARRDPADADVDAPSIPVDAPIPVDAFPLPVDAFPLPVDAPPPMPDAAPPADTDGDGVVDTADVCPTDPTATTTAHTTVEKLYGAKVNEDVPDATGWSFLSGGPYTTLINLPQTYSTDWLYVRQYNLGVPATAKLRGITVRVNRSAGSADNIPVRDLDMRLQYASGSRTPINHASAMPWNPTMATDAFYGGPADLWGRAWTVAEINSVNFGVGLRVRMHDFPDPDIDLVEAIPKIFTIGVAVTYCAQ